jgi:hypothetical protein
MGDIIPLRRATSSRFDGRLRQESARIGAVRLLRRLAVADCFGRNDSPVQGPKMAHKLPSLEEMDIEDLQITHLPADACLSHNATGERVDFYLGKLGSALENGDEYREDEPSR